MIEAIQSAPDPTPPFTCSIHAWQLVGKRVRKTRAGANVTHSWSCSRCPAKVKSMKHYTQRREHAE